MAQSETLEAPSEHEEKLFYCEGDRALQQAAQGGCRITILEDAEKSSGHSPGHPALGGPA